ncbi:MAG: hypothetical protein IKF78_02320 [Atopobiaceae bacterium]|nr:hypothetical protein [Atopobiaceae bacterium]
MERSFHYYGTYCAALIAGYSVEESKELCHSAFLVDKCSRTFLTRIGGPESAATTQLPVEMASARTDPIGLQDITRIWSSFHFLPGNLHAEVKKGGRNYRNKYRLICGPNGDLVADTVNLAQGKGVQAVGLAMHVLADTWAHRYFAGTPSLVINNTNRFFVELVPSEDGSFIERPVKFGHNPAIGDDFDKSMYTNTIFQPSENTIMNLGHGRCGHLPDHSFMRYRYVPAWNGYEEVFKDNPTEYYQAFCQMVYAMKCLRGENGPFQLNTYDTDAVAPYEQEIRTILEKRQPAEDAIEDWRAFGERLCGHAVDYFDLDAHVQEYLDADEDCKEDTYLGKFILAALAQKGMVVNRVWSSGNPLAGRSIEYNGKFFEGIEDFLPLIRYIRGGSKHD